MFLHCPPFASQPLRGTHTEIKQMTNNILYSEKINSKIGKQQTRTTRKSLEDELFVDCSSGHCINFFHTFVNLTLSLLETTR